MNNIEDIRIFIKKSFTNLTKEEPNIVNSNPLNEIIKYMNTGYENINPLDPNIKIIDESFILSESDKIIEEKDFFRSGNSNGGSIFDFPNNNLEGLFGSKSLLHKDSSFENLFSSKPNLFQESSSNSLFPLTFPINISNNEKELSTLKKVDNPLSNLFGSYPNN